MSIIYQTLLSLGTLHPENNSQAMSEFSSLDCKDVSFNANVQAGWDGNSFHGWKPEVEVVEPPRKMLKILHVHPLDTAEFWKYKSSFTGIAFRSVTSDLPSKSNVCLLEKFKYSSSLFQHPDYISTYEADPLEWGLEKQEHCQGSELRSEEGMTGVLFYMQHSPDLVRKRFFEHLWKATYMIHSLKSFRGPTWEDSLLYAWAPTFDTIKKNDIVLARVFFIDILENLLGILVPDDPISTNMMFYEPCSEEIMKSFTSNQNVNELDDDFSSEKIFDFCCILFTNNVDHVCSGEIRQSIRKAHYDESILWSLEQKKVARSFSVLVLICMSMAQYTRESDSFVPSSVLKEFGKWFSSANAVNGIPSYGGTTDNRKCFEQMNKFVCAWRMYFVQKQ